MREHTLIVLVGILASVAIVAVVFDDGGRSAPPSAQEYAPARSELTQAEIARFPRPPLPRTAPQSWVITQDYPSIALASEFEGEVGFRLRVDPSGEVAECQVTRSSGVVAFDRRACSALSTRARFHPALNGDQEAVAGVYQSSVVWMFDDSRMPQSYGFRLETDPSGRMTSCEWSEGDAGAFDPLPICRNALALQPPAGDTFANLPRFLGGSIEAADAERLGRDVRGGR